MDGKMKFKLGGISVLIVIVIALTAIIGVSAKDTCWIENFLSTDYTVCEVEGGIYILTPTPTATKKVKSAISATPVAPVGSIFGSPNPINNFLPDWFEVGSIFGGPDPINNVLPDWNDPTPAPTKNPVR